MNKRFLGIICALAIISSCVLYAAGTTTTTNPADGTNTTQTSTDGNDSTTTSLTSDENGNVQADMTVEFEDPEGAPYYAVKQPHNQKNGGKSGEGDFRTDVKDGVDATIHYIEDNSYKASENSLTYNDDPKATVDVDGKKTKFDGDPDINWTIENTADGSSSNDNNNQDSKQCSFSEAGTYSVHNCGSRQLTEAEGTDNKDTDGVGSPEAGGVADKTDEELKDQPKMTAMGTIPVKIHDVTPPDVWIAFQENDVDINDLKATMTSKMIASSGMPLSEEENSELFGRTSFIFIDEGNTYSKPEGYDQMTDEQKEAEEKKILEQTKVDGRRDMEYPYKSVRVTLAGNIFTANGNALSKTDGKKIVNTVEEDYENLNRKADVDFTKPVKRHEAEKDLTNLELANKGLMDLTNNGKYGQGVGVYARQNVSLLPVVMYCDNGNKRKTVGLIKSTDGQVEEQNDQGETQEAEQQQASSSYYKIVRGDGSEVEPQSDGTYLFRVANYPTETFTDQPKYYFETEVKDKAQNITHVRIPLYVVSNTATDETTSNR